MDDTPTTSPPRRARLRLVHKLFLLLALVTVLSIGALGGATLVNLRSGFVDYVNTLDLARLDPLAQRLAQRVDADAGFDGLRVRIAWQSLLRDVLPAAPPPPPAPAPPRPLRDARMDDVAMDARLPVAAPAAPAPPAGPVPVGVDAPLLPRVSLLDARHRLIAGPPPSPDALERSIERDGRVVGWLSLRPLSQPTDSRDAAFLSTQARTLGWLAAILLALALVAAWVFARHLVKPLHAVERAAASLSGGDYAIDLHTTRRDEIGDLVRHVNRLGAALQANDSARRRWIADISHELRTPLAIARGEVEAMQDGVRAPDADGLRSLHDEVLRLGRLVDDLHQLSMADLGALAYRPVSLDLDMLLREAVARFDGAARAAGLALEFDAGPARHRAMTVRADPDRLRQLIDNLVDNSLRYTDRGGVVRIALRGVDGEARVQVDDSAPGVAADARARLFEPLYRVEASRDRRQGGSGLGLAIAERIAAAHCGRLQAGASPLGGLRMTLSLPLESASA